MRPRAMVRFRYFASTLFLYVPSFVTQPKRKEVFTTKGTKITKLKPFCQESFVAFVCFVVSNNLRKSQRPST
jgi:hypothetical protein